MLALQRAAGNRAVARLVQRQACCADCEQGEPCGGEAADGGEIGDGRDHLHAPRFRGDVVLEACLQDRARLREGMNNRSVFKIQEALFELGYDVGRRGPRQRLRLPHRRRCTAVQDRRAAWLRAVR
jgi:hypothetical protein